jgi:hypothetical protein
MSKKGKKGPPKPHRSAIFVVHAEGGEPQITLHRKGDMLDAFMVVYHSDQALLWYKVPATYEYPPGTWHSHPTYQPGRDPYVLVSTAFAKGTYEVRDPNNPTVKLDFNKSGVFLTGMVD